MPPKFFLNCNLKKNKKASSLQMVPLHIWPTFQMGFCGAPPTLSWPKWGWPNDSRPFCCIVLMQSKWHSSGPFSCSSLPQNTLLLFLPVGLACINSSSFRLIWRQMKTDTGGQCYDYLVTGQPFTSVFKSFEQFQFNPEKMFMNNEIYPYIKEYIYTRKIGKYAPMFSSYDIYYSFMLGLDIVSWWWVHMGLCVHLLMWCNVTLFV